MAVLNNEDGPLDGKFEKLVMETLSFGMVPGVSMAIFEEGKPYAQVSF